VTPQRYAALLKEAGHIRNAFRSALHPYDAADLVHNAVLELLVYAPDLLLDTSPEPLLMAFLKQSIGRVMKRDRRGKRTLLEDAWARHVLASTALEHQTKERAEWFREQAIQLLESGCLSETERAILGLIKNCGKYYRHAVLVDRIVALRDGRVRSRARAPTRACIAGCLQLRVGVFRRVARQLKTRWRFKMP
jgi:hypothetical protein